ncbi:hypothetical protein E2C01_098632 [Portunus trituberculatus]|uniref:Uncharacterized protein n=1 Tax=Portunus trituberculatus TaxID=210409 RepID=A0A5B7K8W8_PORTR|nr:hypothetical protein [Portunus trituberculatus]
MKQLIIERRSPTGSSFWSVAPLLLGKANLAEARLGIPREHPSCFLARGEQGSTKGVVLGCEVPEVRSTPVEEGMERPKDSLTEVISSREEAVPSSFGVPASPEGTSSKTSSTSSENEGQPVASA